MRRIAGLCAVAWLFTAGNAWALDATCADLQAKLDAAAAGDTLTLQSEGGLCPGNYTVPSTSLTLEGEPGAGFQPGALDSGRSLSGGFGDTTIRNLIFRGPSDGRADAGGLSLTGAGALRLEGNTFTGIRHIDYDLDYDGGGARISNDSSSPIAIVANTFGVEGAGNETGGEGGALFVWTGGPIDLDGNAFNSNKAVLNGGGAHILAESAVVARNTFTGNTAGMSGGGLALNTEADDQPARRAASDDTSADQDIIGNRFVGNLAGRNGGGLFAGKIGDLIELAFGATPILRLHDNLYDLNTVAPAGEGSGGGAAFAGVTANSTSERYIRNTVLAASICESDCTSYGGGFSVSFAERHALFTAVNLAVAGNTVGAGGRGGGIGVPVCGECPVVALNLTHATVAGNTVGALGSAAGIFRGGQTVIDRSIVFGNALEGDPEAPESGGYGPLEVRRSDACETPGVPYDSGTVPNTNFCADPMLAGPTRAQGGDVHQTLASPTWDRVESLGDGDVLDDYEGDVRPIFVSSRSATPFDMGADEFNPAEWGVKISATPDSLLLGGFITYTVLVDNNGPGTARDLIVKITLPGPAGRMARVPDGCVGSATVTCSIGSLAAGQRRTLTFAVTPTAVGTVTAVANLTGSSVDLTSDDHADSVTTRVNARPGVIVAPDTAKPARTCKSRREFRIRIRKRRIDPIVSAVVRVNGKLVRTLRGKRLRAPVVLRGLRKGRYRVTIVAERRSGRKIRGTRLYRTCVKKRRSGRVPPL